MKYRATLMLVFEAGSENSAEWTLSDVVASIETEFPRVQVISDEKPIPEDQ